VVGGPWRHRGFLEERSLNGSSAAVGTALNGPRLFIARIWPSRLAARESLPADNIFEQTKIIDVHRKISKLMFPFDLGHWPSGVREVSMAALSLWFVIPAVLATLLTVVVAGALIYSLCEIVGERMIFLQRTRRG
jgi:hypothetical protein